MHDNDPEVDLSVCELHVFSHKFITSSLNWKSTGISQRPNTELLLPIIKHQDGMSTLPLLPKLLSKQVSWR